MANKAIEELLRGNEDQMRVHLACREGLWTGRDDIHRIYSGKLAEYSGMELRHKIVDAHSELLKNERILDLEAQLASLIKQNGEVEGRLQICSHNLTDARNKLYEMGGRP